MVLYCRNPVLADFFQWIVDIEAGNKVSAKGSELIRYVHENEKVKVKLASLMEEAKTNVEEIANLRERIVAHGEECRASLAEVVHLKSKIGRKKKNIVVERNKVKLLGFVIVVLWMFISLLNIVIIMHVGGHRRN